MENNFLIYVCDIVPRYIGIKNPKERGSVARLVFEQELKGNPDYANERYQSVRDRAELMMPYHVPCSALAKREHCLDIIEGIMLQHRQREHGEDHSARILEIKTGEFMTEFEQTILSEKVDFWNI